MVFLQSLVGGVIRVGVKLTRRARGKTHEEGSRAWRTLAGWRIETSCWTSGGLVREDTSSAEEAWWVNNCWTIGSVVGLTAPVAAVGSTLPTSQVEGLSWILLVTGSHHFWWRCSRFMLPPMGLLLVAVFWWPGLGFLHPSLLWPRLVPWVQHHLVHWRHSEE